MSIAPRQRSPSGATALLIIDMQRDFLDPKGYVAQTGVDVSILRKTIEPARRLLGAARAARIRVIHTREGHRPDLSDLNAVKQRRASGAGAPIGSLGPLGRLLVRGEPGHGIIDELAPLAHETIIDKPGFGAFYATDLELVLRAGGISALVIAGVTTDICVHSTLREAMDRGYECTTVADACAAGNPAVHDAMLACIAGEGGILGRVASSDEVIKAWSQSGTSP
ncbi:MAG TPA: isochorismatase family cysteine hydrolase [Steroidobacteraceae bacterium]